MHFTTKIPVTKSQNKIDYNSKLLLLGSCFSENIGNKFTYFKFQTEINPFGIIFNTVSLEKLLLRCIRKQYFTEKDVVFHNDLWHCFEVHSELSNSNKEEFLSKLNEIIDHTNQYIGKLTHCLITLGTSWVYRNIETKEIVANCHKVPQKKFTKELLSTEQIEASLQNIVNEIKKVNATCKFIFTVSPVRHIKDGFFENNVSKGNLFSALNSILKYDSELNYFPSFEIVMDELRDYRFFEKDMLHPNSIAVDYIWEKFLEVYIDKESIELMSEIETIQKGLAHRPFNPNTENHKKFLKNLQDKIDNLANKNLNINFCEQ